MSTLALMRWLESAPARYDRGMRWLTLGRVDEIRDALVQAVAEPGAEVLEIGCGTGAVTARLLNAGARVTALDQSPEMLEIARRRLADPGGECSWLEQTASEIDRLPRGELDAVVASFVLSDMSEDERRFVLAEARERLRPGGRLGIADEVRPRGFLSRALHALLRAPQALLGWLLVGSVSRPIPDLEGETTAAGLRVLSRRTWLGGQLELLVAERPQPGRGSA